MNFPAFFAGSRPQGSGVFTTALWCYYLFFSPSWQGIDNPRAGGREHCWQDRPLLRQKRRATR